MSIEDTGNRRRVTDKVSTDRALELVSSLAYENAVAKGDEAVIASVELAILKLRSLKVETTGVHPILDPDNLPSLMRRQAE
jgi:hypothetical protein